MLVVFRSHGWACAALATFFLVASPEVESAETLHVAGTQEHAWFILNSPETEAEGLSWSLSHTGSRDEAGVYRPMRRFRLKPAAIAVLDNNLWMAMDSTESRPNQIPIQLLQVNWDSRIDRYVPRPTGGFDFLPPIQMEAEKPGIPLDLVATSEGPTILIRHEDGSYSAQEFRQGRWGPLSLPPLKGMAKLGTTGDGLVLLDARGAEIHHWWKSGEGWSSPEVLEGLGTLVEVVPIEDQLLLVTEPESGSFALHYLGNQGLAQLGVWPEEHEKNWSVMGYRGVPVLVLVEDKLQLSEVNPMTGERSSWQVFSMGSPLSMSLWPVLVAFMASLLVLIILIRCRLLDLPEGFMPFAPIARLMALLLDAIPGFIIVFGFLDGQMRMFVDAIFLSLEQDQWLAYACLVAITCAWSLIWELVIGSSPGKSLFGATLIGPEGCPPSWHRKTRRTIFKGVLLLLPVLMITALRPPSLQSASDQGAGVIVVRRRPDLPESSMESTSESDQDS